VSTPAQQNPIFHSTDTDWLHFPGHLSIDLYHTIGLTKFMFLNVVVAGLCFVGFYQLRKNLDRHGYAKGAFFNFLEAILLYIRNEIVIPAIGKKDADRFTPYLWTVFFFVLFGNLMGLVPWMGSPTGALGTTIALALCTFIVVHGSGIKEMGAKHYAETFVPPVPTLILPLLVPIEVISHLVRPAVLAFRLFVNMLAGHTVVYVFLSFIAMELPSVVLYPIVAGLSVTSVVLLSALELLVAFLQAFVFMVLSALYIGGALHPAH
jgi:F-type H+-transporting ATPase subunit a